MHLSSLLYTSKNIRVMLTLYSRYGIIPSNNMNSGPGYVTKDNLALVEKLAGTVR